jgi:hypothetical protein
MIPAARARPATFDGVSVISSLISRISAAVLLVGGLAMLFAAELVLPALVPGTAGAASLLGSLIAAGWLGMASLNWFQRSALLGGIYGRPIVLANFAFYLVTATGLVRPLLSRAAVPWLWVVAAPASVLAVVYAALMFRGPFDPLDKPAAAPPR